MDTNTTSEFGLDAQETGFLFRLFTDIPTVERVIIFGSRTMTNCPPDSDVDLAIVGTKVTAPDVAQIRAILEKEGAATFGYDVLHYDTLKHQDLKEQIDSYGKVFYTRS